MEVIAISAKKMVVSMIGENRRILHASKRRLTPVVVVVLVDFTRIVV